MYNSDARQDEFVSKILKNKTDGFYMDIGSCHSIHSNNSFYFETIGWSGICVEIESQYNDSYNSRKNCIYINSDATKINYTDVLERNKAPKIIDYLSLDIDTLSYQVLHIIPFNEYKFRIITIEHDAYLYGDRYRKLQRDYLVSLGYSLLCSNVYVQQPGFDRPMSPFEDWWIYPQELDMSNLESVYCDSLYPSEIISKLKNSQ